MDFLVHPIKCAVSMLCSAIMVLFALLYLLSGRPLETVVFCLLSCIYLFAVVRYGTVLRIDQDGIQGRFLRHSRGFVKWSSLAEIGVVGTKVVQKKSDDDVGAKFIYFSSEPMSDDQLYRICLAWPPKKLLYLHFSLRAFKHVQIFWNREIRIYNVDEIDLGF